MICCEGGGGDGGSGNRDWRLKNDAQCTNSNSLISNHQARVKYHKKEKKKEKILSILLFR